MLNSWDKQSINPLLPNIHTPSEAISIESGYFVFTLMPSLRCHLNCPHCYLSLDQRQNSPIMSIEDLKTATLKVDAYYEKQQIAKKTIVCYWYGGEPTDMGQDYFIQACETINAIFTPEKGYNVKHTVLTSLLTIDDSWFDIFHKYGKGEFQSSFDGFMRGGKNYVKKWENKVRKAVEAGLKISTISVVNHEILKDGPQKTLDYLADLKVQETSWLPFMWNEQNDGKQYIKFAPTMDKWSNFMIELTQHYQLRKQQNLYTPEIGQLWFTLTQGSKGEMANIAGQTLFLLPNGDFVLPDYQFGFKEYMRVFGNILEQDFNSILTSKERRSYLRKQVLKNNNKECIECEYSDRCVMEFWKENRPNDDCFGGKKFIQWVEKNIDSQKFTNTTLY